jgi:hypothetical protein
MTIKEQKIKEITSHPDFNRSRTLTSLLKAIEVGISLEEEDRLFLIVQEAFKYGKPKRQSYIKHAFKKDMKFLRREFKGIVS